MKIIMSWPVKVCEASVPGGYSDWWSGNKVRLISRYKCHTIDVMYFCKHIMFLSMIWTTEKYDIWLSFALVKLVSCRSGKMFSWEWPRKRNFFWSEKRRQKHIELFKVWFSEIEVYIEPNISISQDYSGERPSLVRILIKLLVSDFIVKELLHF